MTLHEGLAFGLIGCTLLLFVWGRFRYDLVSLCALLTGVLVGVVPSQHAFDGFKSDVVVIIAAALVVSAAFQRSGIVEVMMRPLLSRLTREQTQVPVLTAATAVLSMATKNVGALAIMMPIAQQLSRKSGTAVSRLLMPMATASLLGGLVTLVGTSTNIIVSQVREQTLGKPFAMYDFAPVGLGLTVLALAFLAFGYRLLPRDRTGATPLAETLAEATYVTEARAPANWSHGPKRIAELRQAEGGDVLMLEGDADVLHRVIADWKMEPGRAHNPLEKREAKEDIRSIEVVVGADSPLIGRSARGAALQSEYNVKLLALARNGRRVTARLRTASIRAGDILVLRGPESDLPKALQGLGALPLAERSVRLGTRRPLVLPAVILACAMVLVALKLLPIAIAFMGAAVLMILFRTLSMRDAYASLDGPVLVLIGALTPVSEALQRTGGADLLASGFSAVFGHLPDQVVLASLMLGAMICSPFLHNAPTVLILGPVAVGVAHRLGLSPDPLLMAVATGAGCDFLTPVGHQCNTMVLGPGGYRFSDYARLGAPLSLLVILVGTALIAIVWPLHGH